MISLSIKNFNGFLLGMRVFK